MADNCTMQLPHASREQDLNPSCIGEFSKAGQMSYNGKPRMTPNLVSADVSRSDAACRFVEDGIVSVLLSQSEKNLIFCPTRMNQNAKVLLPIHDREVVPGLVGDGCSGCSADETIVNRSRHWQLPASTSPAAFVPKSSIEITHQTASIPCTAEADSSMIPSRASAPEYGLVADACQTRAGGDLFQDLLLRDGRKTGASAGDIHRHDGIFEKNDAFSSQHDDCLHRILLSTTERSTGKQDSSAFPLYADGKESLSTSRAATKSSCKLPCQKELLYRAAAFQPINVSDVVVSTSRPKRKNVRISNDPQSVAARHRRQRISDKIRILQRLVPGGIKMDTASMLEEAVQYLKFLKMEVETMEAMAKTVHPATAKLHNSNYKSHPIAASAGLSSPSIDLNYHLAPFQAFSACNNSTAAAISSVSRSQNHSSFSDQQFDALSKFCKQGSSTLRTF